MDDARKMTPKERFAMERATLETHTEMHAALARRQMRAGKAAAEQVVKEMGVTLHPRLRARRGQR